MDITAEERHFARHALGLTRGKLGYRNFYAAGEGDGAAVGRALAAKGLAVEIKTGAHRPDVNFVITLSGFLAVAEAGEEMDEEETAKMVDRAGRDDFAHHVKHGAFALQPRLTMSKSN